MEVHLPFLLCFILYLRAIFQVQAPGGLYLEGLNYTRRGLLSEFYFIKMSVFFFEKTKREGKNF